MKKFKLLNFMLLMIVALFMREIEVMGLTTKDIPNSITISSEGNYLTSYTNNNYIPAKYDFVTNGNPHFPVKHYNGPSTNDYNNVYCTSGLAISQPPSGLTCTKIAWDNSSDAYAVGYIIQKLHGGKSSFTSESYPQYYWSELMINSYLNNFDGTRDDGSDYDLKAGVINSSSYKVMDIDTYQSILAGATNYASTAGANPTITLSTSVLTFTDGGDGYYYSNKISISTSGTLTFETSDGLEHYMDGGYHRFKIKNTDLNIGTTTLSATVKSTATYFYSQRYDCGDYQKVTPAVAYLQTKTDTATLKGSITTSTVRLLIAKSDKDGNIIEGSKLLFQTEAQKNAGEGGIEMTPGADGVYTDFLNPGKYYLSEIEAPTGYNKFDGYMEIFIENIDGNGSIYVDGEKHGSRIIRLKNTMTETKFSKISIVNQKELPGATLTILNENKEVITDEEGNALYEWVSGEEPHYIYGLPVGKYYLKEVKAPEGYALSEEIVAFEVKGDGTVTEVVMENALEVKVPDTLSSKSVLLLFIGMFDVALGIGILLYVKKNKVTE